MTARCLRCGAGNEWIEGTATHKAVAQTTTKKRISCVGHDCEECAKVRRVFGAAMSWFNWWQAHAASKPGDERELLIWKACAAAKKGKVRK